MLIQTLGTNKMHLKNVVHKMASILPQPQCISLSCAEQMYFTMLSSLLMSWRHKEPCHQQAWYWLSFHGILGCQHQINTLSPIRTGTIKWYLALIQVMAFCMFDAKCHVNHWQLTPKRTFTPLWQWCGSITWIRWFLMCCLICNYIYAIPKRCGHLLSVRNLTVSG